jgi:hypothetical protein
VATVILFCALRVVTRKKNRIPPRAVFNENVLLLFEWIFMLFGKARFFCGLLLGHGRLGCRKLGVVLSQRGGCCEP